MQNLPKKVLTLLLLLLFATSASAQRGKDDKQVLPANRTLFYENATVHVSPERVEKKTHVLVDNGLIVAVGKRLTAPAGARVIAADTLHLYAGFIHGMTHAGIPKEKEDNTRADDPSNPPNELAGIEPQKLAFEQLDMKEKELEGLRKAGFTVVHVVPRGRMLPGKGTLMLLGVKEPNQLLLQPQISQFSQFAGARRMYPATVIGIMAKWRDMYRNAESLEANQRDYMANPLGRYYA